MRAAVLGLLVLVGPHAAGAAEPADPFAECEASLARGPSEWYACGCFRTIANQKGLQAEAIARLERIRAADPDDPCLPFTLGRLHLERREAEPAVPLFEQAADTFAARGISDGEVYSRINLAQARLYTLAPAERVVGELARALDVATAAGDPGLEATVVAREAQWLLRLGGDLDTVDATLRRLLGDAATRGDAGLEASLLLSQGELRYRLGRFEDAEDDFGAAIEVTSAAGLRLQEATARANLAAAVGAGLPSEELRVKVVALLDTALGTAQASGNVGAEVQVRTRLARLLGGEAAREHLQAALALAEPRRDTAPVDLAAVLSASAFDLLSDDPAEARRRVDEAASLLARSDDPWDQVYGWGDRLRVVWATSPRDEAVTAALDTIALADRLAAAQGTEGTRGEVASVWTEIYQWLGGRLLVDAEADGDPVALAQAFEVGERMRARLLLESLAAADVRPGELAEDADPSLEAAWRRIEADIVGVQRRLLDPSLAPADREELRDALRELETEEDRLAVRRREVLSPGAAFPDDFASLDEIRADLAPNEALVTFQVGLWRTLEGSFAGGAWALTVTPDGARLHRLPGRAELESDVDVDMLRHTFDGRNGSETGPAVALYDLVLRDALADLPPEVERLVLIPDGPFENLPFAALREAPDAPPLAARYELFVTPSATVWRRLRSLEPRSAMALAIADPTTPGGAPAGEAVSGSDRSRTDGVRLSALPHSRREGRDALDDLGTPGRLLVGSDATERAVKEGTAPGLRLLHFGTHAVLDEDQPQRSAVVLAPGAEDEDGLLRPREAAELGLDGTVVVLAACQSASGTVLEGEGALSLARAFVAGGARAVVGNLWPVEDEEAADFLDRFYRHLGHGDSVARALARSQREAIETGAPAAAWAGWTVLGDGGATVAPKRLGRLLDAPRQAWVLALLLVLVLVLAGAATVVFLKRH